MRTFLVALVLGLTGFFWLSISAGLEKDKLNKRRLAIELIILILLLFIIIKEFKIIPMI